MVEVREKLQFCLKVNEHIVFEVTFFCIQPEHSVSVTLCCTRLNTTMKNLNNATFSIIEFASFMHLITLYQHVLTMLTEHHIQ